MAMTALERKRRDKSRVTMPATGYCGECGKKVPHGSLNAFVCSEKCRRKGWRRHNPGKKEPDWDRLVQAVQLEILLHGPPSYD